MRLPAETATGGLAFGYPSDPVIEGKAHADAIRAAEAALGPAQMARVWAFFDQTRTWLQIHEHPPALGQPLQQEELRQAAAEYAAVRQVAESFLKSATVAHNQRGGQGPLPELGRVLPELLGGQLCCTGVAQNGVDVGAQHDAFVAAAIKSTAEALGPACRAAACRPKFRSSIQHVQELNGVCDLSQPFYQIPLEPPAASAPAAAPASAQGAGPSSGSTQRR